MEFTQQRLQILGIPFYSPAIVIMGICHGPYLGKLRNDMIEDICSLKWSKWIFIPLAWYVYGSCSMKS